MKRIPYRQLVKALPFRQSFTCSGHVKASSYPPPLASLPTSTHVAPLTHRALVRVEGTDASTLLQGVVTCDVFSGSEATYSMMLNVQGRVLYDVMLYQHNGGHLLECDARAALDIVKHLKKYALRSKVEVSLADSDYGLWAAFPGTPGETSSQKVASFFSDPRVSEFGTRVLLPQGVHAPELLTDLKECTSDVYHRHRLEMGIPEGMDEILVGKGLPLEYNLDYMNGVSFNKGCYLGQELTARTHHTGVVRKRIMPIALGESPDKPLQTGTSITAGGKSVGKLVCHHGSVGLALLRLQEIAKGNLSLESFDGKQIIVTVHRPAWWPS